MSVGQYLTSLLDTGHRHTEFKQMMLCDHCGERFRKAEAEWQRLKVERPEEFRAPVQKMEPSQKNLNLWDQLMERLKVDKEYREEGFRKGILRK